jgi:hypothetical protein
VTAEGLQLDRKGLKLLRELAELDRQIEHAASRGPSGEERWARLTARRLMTRREAKSHCGQAGIDWARFKETLERSKRAGA